MPENEIDNAIQPAWRAFTESVQPLLGPRPDDRPLDQYLAYRDAVLAMVRGEKFLKELQKAWTPSTNEPEIQKLDDDVRIALLMELTAFPLAVEVAKATEEPAAPKRWWSRWLGRASTVTGSVTDLLNLSPYAKGALTVFKELIDLFKGKED